MNDNELTKKCKSCFNDIHLKAKKCIHCDSYQNWKRYLNLSNSVLALSIAFLSVIGIVGPKIQKLIDGNYSKLTVRTYTITKKGVSLLCINEGTEPGYISNCKIVLLDKSNNQKIWEFNLDLQEINQTKIIKEKEVSEKYYELKYHYFKDRVNYFSKQFEKGIDDENFIFMVNVKVGQFNNNEKTVLYGPSQVKDLFYNLREN